MTIDYDAIVVGSGQAGPFLAVRLAQAGMRTALVEREHLGGTCVNDGCIPTKALLASARAAHVARHASDLGVMVPGPVTVDMRAIKARKDRIVGHSITSLTRWLAAQERLDLVWGHARFVDASSLAVGSDRLRAPRIFINVGGRARVPDWPGIDRLPVLTNTTMMALDELPRHLLVAGGSYIGLEFAQMYRRFGAQVTVLEAGPRLLPAEDDDVAQAVHAMLAAEGIAFHFGVREVRVLDAAEPTLELHGHAGAQRLQGSHLLSAIGRRPNTDDLGLEHAGLATDARGFIPVDERLRTVVPGIWALGDVNGRGGFTHTAYDDYQIVAANLLDGASRSVDERIPAYALFTDPPLGRVGLSERQARASGRPTLIGVLPMARVGRARERGETTGFMKVLVDAASERIVGAALLGIEGDEVVHTLLAAMQAGMSYRQLRQGMPIHPTVSELIPTLLAQLRPLAN